MCEGHRVTAYLVTDGFEDVRLEFDLVPIDPHRDVSEDIPIPDAPEVGHEHTHGGA